MEKFQIGLYEKAIPNEYSISEKLEIAKELGYNYLELSIDETDDKLARLDMSDSQIESIKRSIEKNVPIGSICLSGHRKYPLGSSDIKTQERSLEIMEKAIILASKLGIRIIQLAGYDVYYEESSAQTLKDFEENLKKCAYMASAYGIILGFETMETPFMDTVEKSMKYVNIVNSPYLHVYPDTGNLKNASLLYGPSVEEDMETGKGHIVALHLKETVPGKYREIPYCTGHVDFNSIIKKALEMGVFRFVTEMWYVGQEEWKEDIKYAITTMKTIIEKNIS